LWLPAFLGLAMTAFNNSLRYAVVPLNHVSGFSPAACSSQQLNLVIMDTIGNVFLQTVIARFAYYKGLGDAAFAQLEERDFYFQPDEVSNSIAVIIQHMEGNMRSRWTNFLTEDGEKEGRNRDAEFEAREHTKARLLEMWNEGWDCLFQALRSLGEDDLLKTVYIRTEPHLVIDAINRQLAHYPYHVGQIVYLGREIKKATWKSLSIPKGASAAYNTQMAKR
jgi:uncharacterized damage-inducible protein DinB